MRNASIYKEAFYQSYKWFKVFLPFCGGICCQRYVLSISWFHFQISSVSQANGILRVHPFATTKVSFQPKPKWGLPFFLPIIPSIFFVSHWTERPTWHLNCLPSEFNSWAWLRSYWLAMVMWPQGYSGQLSKDWHDPSSLKWYLTYLIWNWSIFYLLWRAIT